MIILRFKPGNNLEEILKKNELSVLKLFEQPINNVIAYSPELNALYSGPSRRLILKELKIWLKNEAKLSGEDIQIIAGNIQAVSRGVYIEKYSQSNTPKADKEKRAVSYQDSYHSTSALPLPANQKKYSDFDQGGDFFESALDRIAAEAARTTANRKKEKKERDTIFKLRKRLEAI